MEGVGEDFWPTTFDPSVVDRTVMVTDAESFAAARRVTREEGLLIGGSCGTAVHAALVLGEELGPDALVVVLLPDSGRNYLSKIYDDRWMTDYGFLRAGDGPCAGDVIEARSLRRPGPGGGGTGPARQRGGGPHAGARHLPGSGQRLLPSGRSRRRRSWARCGSSSSWTRRLRDPGVLDRRVEDVMGPRLPMVGIGEPLGRLVDELERANAVLVLDGGHPCSVISRADLLSFLGGADRD